MDWPKYQIYFHDAGEFESYNYLINMAEKYVKRTTADLLEAKNRKEQIEKLNDQVDIAIQNIPTTIQQTVTETVRRNHCFFWRRTWYTRTYTIEVIATTRASNQLVVTVILIVICSN